MKILIADCATLTQNNDLDITVFEKYGDVVYNTNILRDELLSTVHEYDIILCNKTIIDKDVIENAKKLKFIGLWATGYNNIDITAAKENGITVCNAGSYSTSAVAQQVFAYILNHYNAVNRYNDFVKNGGWQQSPTFSVLCFPTDELKDKTIGIIGYGSIGKRVAEIALAFEMNVLVYTRTPKTDNRVKFTSLDKLLKNSDIITPHCPLNDGSIEMFNKDTFSKMKDGAFFINTARGGIVNEQDLADALNSGKLSGAAIDVLNKEPMSNNCILKDIPNLIITPHTAWAPLATRERLIKIAENNIISFLNGFPTNKVN
ncbi:MAG: D-2-hydroxyacid dehydrogenase [Ruminococcaceae bacterium]|nr:D-2-hydroxyacid dehydrogenase [Oscillospiraceae bacterium]